MLRPDPTPPAPSPVPHLLGKFFPCLTRHGQITSDLKPLPVSPRPLIVSKLQFHLMTNVDEIDILWYYIVVNRKPLIQTNPYLKHPKNRQILLSIAVSSSTAIEGVHEVVPEAAPFRPSGGKTPILREPVVPYGSRR